MESGARHRVEGLGSSAAASVRASHSASSISSPPVHPGKEPFNKHDTLQNPYWKEGTPPERRNLISTTAVGAIGKAKKSYRDACRLPFGFRQVASRWWLWELLACIGSLLSLLAIVIFLACYDGHAQPQWPSYITVNTIVSLFAALTKATILLSTAACIGQAKWTHYQASPRPLTDFVTYDDASRGPLGSVSLIWLLKGRYIASLGALVTILAVAIDPSVQQMVTIQTKQANATAAAHLGRAQSFLQFAGSEDQFQTSLPTTEMVGAIFSGMFFGAGGTQDNLLDISPSCPTGNCTYPTFQSLAVCSGCEDVTPSIKRTCHDGTYGSAVEPNSSYGKLYCELSLPNGLKVNDSGENNIYGAFASSGYLPPVGQPKIGNTVLNFSRIQGPQEDIHGKETQAPRATQCSLYWCVNTYQSRVRNARLEENITHSWHSETTEWFFHSETMNGQRLDLVPPSTSEQPSNNSNFTVAYLATKGLSSWLSEKATTSNSQAVSVEDGVLAWGPDDSANISSSSADMLRVFRDSDPSTLFANIAKSMVRNIRSVNSSQQTTVEMLDGYMKPVGGVGPANGTAQALQVYISVRWPWLTLSASLVAAAVILLTLTVTDSARRDFSEWRSSPLPILLQAVQEPKSDALEPARGIAEMERLASEIDVELKGDQSGSKLAEHRITRV